MKDGQESTQLLRQAKKMFKEAFLSRQQFIHRKWRWENMLEVVKSQHPTQYAKLVEYVNEYYTRWGIQEKQAKTGLDLQKTRKSNVGGN